MVNSERAAGSGRSSAEPERVTAGMIHGGTGESKGRLRAGEVEGGTSTDWLITKGLP